MEIWDVKIKEKKWNKYRKTFKMSARLSVERITRNADIVNLCVKEY